MGRYFEYRDWDIEDLANSIREELAEARKPIPPKIQKHVITIKYQTGEGRYSYSYENDWSIRHDEFTSVEEAVEFINSHSWIERIGENMWVDSSRYNTYTDKEGNKVPYHYGIYEYDTEIYEDGEYHTEYTEDEIKDLSDALFHIEKARVYMRTFDNARSNWSFGNGRFHDELLEEMDKFEKEYTEDLPEDYYDDNN